MRKPFIVLTHSHQKSNTVQSFDGEVSCGIHGLSIWLTIFSFEWVEVG